MGDWLTMQPPRPWGMHARTAGALQPMLGRPFTKEDRARAPITVNNRVFRVRVDRRTSFMDMLRNMLTHCRREVKFPQIRVSFAHAEVHEVAAVMTYTKGLWVVCGTRSIHTAVRATQLLRLSLQQCGIAIGLVDVTSVNAVVNAHMPFQINIDRAVESRELPSMAHREKDFPGTVFRVRGVEVLAFPNGRCVLTGAPDVVEMELVRSIVTDLLGRFRVQDDDPQRMHEPLAASARPSRSSLKKSAQTPAAGAKPKPAARRARKTDTDGTKQETFANRRRRERREASRVQAAPTGESRARGRTKGVAFQINKEMTRVPGETEAEARKRASSADAVLPPTKKKQPTDD